MRLTTSIVAAVALLSPGFAAGQSQALVTRVTSRPVEQFGKCFIAAQQRAARPWWFVPSETGGTFSNSGANDTEGVYFLRVQRSSNGAETRLLLEGASPEASRAVSAVIDACV